MRNREFLCFLQGESGRSSGMRFDLGKRTIGGPNRKFGMHWEGEVVLPAVLVGRRLRHWTYKGRRVDTFCTSFSLILSDSFDLPRQGTRFFQERNQFLRLMNSFTSNPFRLPCVPNSSSWMSIPCVYRPETCFYRKVDYFAHRFFSFFFFFRELPYYVRFANNIFLREYSLMSCL